MIADELIINDIKKQTLEMASFKNEKIKTNIKLNEKRF